MSVAAPALPSMRNTVTLDSFYQYFLECKLRGLLSAPAVTAGEIYEGKIKGQQLMAALQDSEVRSSLKCFHWGVGFQEFLMEQCSQASKDYEFVSKALDFEEKFKYGLEGVTRIEGWL